MTTEEMILLADPGPRPDWGREAANPSVLVEVAREELGLKAAAKLLDEHAEKTGMRIVEVARSRNARGSHEGVYARCEPLRDVPEQASEAAIAQLQKLSQTTEQMNQDMSAAVLGRKP